MQEYFKQWRKYIGFGFFFSLFINVLQLTFPVYMLQIYDRVLTSYSMPTLLVITVAALLSLVVMAGLEFVRSRLLVRCGVAIDQALSLDVFTNVLKQEALPGVSPEAGLKDVNILRNFFAGNAIFTIFDIPWTPIFLGVIYLLHPILGFVALGGALLLAFLAVLNERLGRKPLDMANAINSSAMGFVATGTRNSRLVCGMGMINSLANRWGAMNDSVTNLQTKASRNSGMIQSVTSGIRQSMQVFIYGVGAYLTLINEASPGVMIAASIIMGRALAPIQMSIGSWKSMVEARRSYKNLKMLFANRKERPRMDLPDPQGSVMVEKGAFAIQNKYILQNINFSLDPGEAMGLIGPSGAGKSTLCHLLLGVWPSVGGKVRLDGSDIFIWDKEKLGKHIGYLPQDVELFSGTIGDNIARFNEVDSDKVIDAAKKAGVHELVLNLPDGYDTYIGPGGLVLSGGQRQRIGLARALYGDPRLVILDEPNSNLDEEGEKSLLGAWKILKEMRQTLIVVSHKPSLLLGMDKILMLQNGQVAMFGPKDQVFAKLNQQAAQMAQPQALIAKEN